MSPRRVSYMTDKESKMDRLSVKNKKSSSDVWRTLTPFLLGGLLLCFGLTSNITETSLCVYGQESDDGWGAAGANTGGAQWSDTDADVSAAQSRGSSTTDASAGSETFSGPTTTRYSLELAKLPNDDGQFWVVYDIAPYTDRLPNLTSPQDSIVDWILFDSGEGFWRKEPFCILSASRDRLYVYHGENVQRYVSNIVDRFIDPSKHSSAFIVRVVALQTPDWRSRVSQYLSPLSVTIVGNGADVQGWQVERGNMAKVTSELEKRSDYVPLNSGNNLVPNGETFGWAAAQPRNEFKRDYRVDPSSSTGYSTDVASVDEGFRIETTPLLSTTGENLELTFRYRSTVVEKMKSFSMRVPTPTSPRQQLNVEKPSIVSCDFRGKISIPRTRAAIIDLGLVPIALPKKTNEQGNVIESVSGLISQKSAFYNVLLVIEEAGN